MSKFTDKAPWIMAALMHRLDIGVEDAAAILGNIGHECNGFENLQQVNGSAYGWVQWDGSRRDDYFKWCNNNNLNRASDEANYRYLVYELTETWEKRVLPELRAAPTLDAKVETFERLFERAGVKHYASRKIWAQRALDAYRVAGDVMVPEFAGGRAVPAEDTGFVVGVVPAGWVQRVNMDGIVAHWTAGRHKASDLDREHYHIIIEGDGTLVQGTKTIRDNVNTTDGKYAAHTRGLNTRRIGVAMACMWNAKESPFDPGPAPMTRVQWDKMIEVLADLVTFYKIPVTPKTVLSHAEVEPTLGIKQAGKWDFTRLAFDSSVTGARACGDKMRSELLAELARRKAPVVTVEEREEEETTSTVPSDVGAATGGAAAGAVVGGTAAYALWGDWVLLGIVVVATALVFVGIMLWRRNRRKKRREKEEAAKPKPEPETETEPSEPNGDEGE